MTKPDGRLGSHPMYEFEGGSRPIAFYVRGHIDKSEFLAEVREYWGGLSDDATVAHVRHEHWRCVPCGEPGRHMMVPAASNGRGAFPITVIDN